ncbi:adenosine deaminase [Marinilactibacillus kalidii]|uniref:adenosine deaminase n=1 Tax=Marinilactibacillus kalidii TaxID=2820274 RepID=UPI001ABE85A1|nr:adenosine deaminase [Marinilactibacillus kalidii]
MDRARIHQLPKVELHCHLDGSVPMKFLKTLAREHGIEESIMDQAIAPADCENLKDYLDCFDVILSVLQTKESLTSATYAVVEAAAEENVQYLELRFAPLLHQQKGLTAKQVINAVSQGVIKAMQDYPIYVNILVCAMRYDTEEKNTQLYQDVFDLQADHVVGIDVAGDEEQYPNESVQKAVTSAKNKGFQITMHSGECGCAHNVVTAMHFGAKRIGHGVAIENDLDVMKEVKARNVLLELCPSSNIQTRAVKDWSVYPLRRFIDQGLAISINTDNRTVSNTTLTDEFLQCVKHCQLTEQEMGMITQTAMHHAFAAQTLKKEILKTIAVAYKM